MFTKTRYALLTAAIFAGGIHAEAAITLAEAVAQARSGSPDARVAEARVAMSRAVLTGAGSAGMPHVSLQSTYMQTNSPMTAFGAILNQGTFDNSINFNKPGQTDALTTGIYVRQSLYAGGRIRSGRQAAQAGAEAAEYERQWALMNLDGEVVRAYFTIRQAQQSVGALDAALASYDENLRVARLRESAGQMLKSERLNLDVQRARTESQLLAARQQVDLARAAFAVLLGLPANTALELADNDASIDTILTPASLPQTANWPELAAMDRRVNAAKEQVKIARAARMPTVDAFASVQDDRGWRREGDGQSWTAGVVASVTLFDGRETDSRIREAKAQFDEATEMRRKVELALQLRLKQARINHDAALGQLEVCRRQVEQADESARLSRERFSAGALLSAELIGVETRLTEARVQLAQSEASERVALADLRIALALPIFTTEK
jgi:outer membrane protein